MATPLLICIKAVNGGVFVALFAVLGEMLRPKRFAGIFGASPAVALANLLVIAIVEGDASARNAATGMIVGAIALVVACAAAFPAVRRWGAVRGSAVMWVVWMVVGAAVAFPLSGAPAAASGAGLPAGRGAGGKTTARDKSVTGDKPATGGDGGGKSGRLFGFDLAALREVRPPALALRFAFGAAVSIVAGLIGVVAGKRAGGVLLAAPAVLPATLTIIERQEGRRPAVTEVQGSVPGAVALIGFALVVTAATGRLPLVADLLCGLASWVVVALGGYLVQGAVLPTWRTEVRRLADQRRDAVEGHRGRAGAGERRAPG